MHEKPSGNTIRQPFSHIQYLFKRVLKEWVEGVRIQFSRPKFCSDPSAPFQVYLNTPSSPFPILPKYHSIPSSKKCMDKPQWFNLPKNVGGMWRKRSERTSQGNLNSAPADFPGALQIILDKPLHWLDFNFA